MTGAAGPSAKLAPFWDLWGEDPALDRLAVHRQAVNRAVDRLAVHRQAVNPAVHRQAGNPAVNRAVDRLAVHRQAVNPAVHRLRSTTKLECHRQTVDRAVHRQAVDRAVHRQCSTIGLKRPIWPLLHPGSKWNPDASSPYKGYPLYGNAITHWPQPV
jgi:stage V sporulation protein SpoVS